jgi:hypothetical protein
MLQLRIFLCAFDKDVTVSRTRCSKQPQSNSHWAHPQGQHIVNGVVERVAGRCGIFKTLSHQVVVHARRHHCKERMSNHAWQRQTRSVGLVGVVAAHDATAIEANNAEIEAVKFALCQRV